MEFISKPSLSLSKRLPQSVYNEIIFNDHRHIIKFLYANSEFVDNVLEYASQQNDYMLIDQIIQEFHSDINFDNNILINIAADRGHYKTVDYLLKNGAELNKNTIMFCTATYQVSPNLLLLLIDYGANVRIEDDFPLKMSAMCCNLAHVKILLDANCDIHASQDYALRISIQKRYITMAKFLIDSRANVHAHNNYSLREMALTNYSDIIQLLLDADADIHVDDDFVLRETVKRCDKSIIKSLLDLNANIHANNDEALKNAVLACNTDVVELLLEYDADISILNQYQSNTVSDHNKLRLLKILEDIGISNTQAVLLILNSCTNN